MVTLKVFFTILFINFCCGYNILVFFPFKVKSHHYFNNFIVKSLAEDNNITFINSCKSEYVDNINYVKYSIKGLNAVNYTRDSNNKIIINKEDYEKIHIDKKILIDQNKKNFRDLLTNKSITLNYFDKKYDIMIIGDYFDYYKILLPLSSHLKIPVLLTKAFDNNFNVKMFDDDDINLITQQEYNLNFTTESNIKYLSLINTHKSFYEFPISPYNIEIGGGEVIHYKTKQLDKNVEEFINKSNKTIIFSFGSVINETSLSQDLMKNIISSFEKLQEYNVIFRIHDKILASKYKNYTKTNNIMFVNFMQQKEILDHKKVVLFVNHGGLNSIYESIFYKVPMISIPIFGDHFKNSKIIEEKKIGISLDSQIFNEDLFIEHIKNVINDDQYKKNIELLRSEFVDRQTTPKEDIKFYTEYVIRHKYKYIF